MGQESFLHAGHHDHRELEALGLVQRDESEGVFGLLVLVDIGYEGYALEERAEAVDTAVAGRAVVPGEAAQFQDVFPTFVAVVLGVNVFGQARHIEDAIQQVGDGEFSGGVAQAVQSHGKVGDGTGGAGGDVYATGEGFDFGLERLRFPVIAARVVISAPGGVGRSVTCKLLAPMPRGGVLMMRCRLTSSPGL